jgi:DNA invertase Pin-like site-specific DNA recombinase
MAAKLVAINWLTAISFENERREDRQRQRIQTAKKNGKYLGRKTVIDKKLIDQVKYLKETKNLSITQVAKITGRARCTIYKILKAELNYIPYNRLVKATERKEETNDSN